MDAMAMVRKLPRMWQWYLIAAVLVVVIWLVTPQQVPVVIYKLCMLVIAAVLAFCVDRSLFKVLQHAVPSSDAIFSAARMIARALVFLAVVIGVTLGI
jgi:hypothetical protein